MGERIKHLIGSYLVGGRGAARNNGARNIVPISAIPAMTARALSLIELGACPSAQLIVESTEAFVAAVCDQIYSPEDIDYPR